MRIYICGHVQDPLSWYQTKLLEPHTPFGADLGRLHPSRVLASPGEGWLPRPSPVPSPFSDLFAMDHLWAHQLAPLVAIMPKDTGVDLHIPETLVCWGKTHLDHATRLLCPFTYLLFPTCLPRCSVAAGVCWSLMCFLPDAGCVFCHRVRRSGGPALDIP